MQHGPLLPASASISAYHSILILEGFYKDLCKKLEAVLSGDTRFDGVRVLLQESVALSRTLTQLLEVLDSDRTGSFGACIRPGEIIVSLTDALLLMCRVQESIGPLIESTASLGNDSDAHWKSTDLEILWVAHGLKKQTTAFSFQLTLLSW